MSILKHAWVLSLFLVACMPDRAPPLVKTECRPACAAKTCGDDGCGGVCGTCNVSADCVADVCVARPTCSDARQNGVETDIDCGGTACDRCGVGKTCAQPSDCASGLCVGGFCQAPPTCSDRKKNGDETDVDCGGPECDACEVTRICNASTDCLSQICTNEVCRDPSCSDELLNQGESDVDCGGPCSLKCGVTESCTGDGDCASDICDEGTCVACRSTCSQDGESRCVADDIQTCVADADGCFQWGVVTSCSTGRFCDDAENTCVAIGCGDVPFDGRCVDASSFEYCTVLPLDGTPVVMTSACDDNEACEQSGSGATCVIQSECQDGETECLNAGELRACVDGMWTQTSCENGCSDSNPLEAFCHPPSPTTSVTGTVSYMARTPNAQRSDWGALTSFPARGFLVVSLADREGSGELDILDAVKAEGEDGAFTIEVLRERGPDDRIVVLAAGYGADGKLRHVVANPGFDAMREEEIDTVGDEPSVWSWAWELSSLPDLVIEEEDGSGAARVFDIQEHVFSTTDAIYPNKTGLSLVTWMGVGTDWDCGACFWRKSRSVFDTSFKSQMWIGGGANGDYWADAVTAHELGHWVMSSYGTSPNEGGTHWLGVPTFPGQAWSEGFATWFSSVVRRDPIYLDKQGGGMFWLDISQRVYPWGSPWQRPTPGGGLLQKMDENEVSAMLWQLGQFDEDTPVGMLEVFAEPQMNTSPWARGYTRHTWDVDSNGEHSNVVNTGQRQPSLPDFFDALMCVGFPAAQMDAATEPLTAYPYSSAAPLCAGAFSP